MREREGDGAKPIAPATPTAPGASTAAGDLHVLLVDDHTPVLRFLSTVLAASGCRVLTASTAEEAIALVSRHAFDLVITDIHMPGHSGLEVLTAVKDCRPETPVVLLTGRPSVESAVFGVRHRAYDYLAKPITASEVRELLDRVRRDGASRRAAAPGPATDPAPWGGVQAFSELADLAMGTQDIGGFLDAALPEILAGIHCEAAVVLLRDAGGTVVTHRAGAPAMAAELAALSQPLLDGKLGAETVAALGAAEAPVAGLAAGLPSTGTRRGLLAVGRGSGAAFQPAERNLVRGFARMTGLAFMKVLLRENLEDNLVDTISSFLIALESKDSYLKGHSARVSLYAGEIAKALALPSSQVALARRAGMLHDLGKLVMFDSILLKPSRLSGEEFALMKAHPLVAAKILKPLRFLGEEADAIRAHHERYDGTGYPDGLKGDAIPLAGRILTAADAFDAMVSDRPYRRALAPAAALQEILRHQRTQFDPAVAQAFASIPMERLLEISRFHVQSQPAPEAPAHPAGARSSEPPGVVEAAGATPPVGPRDVDRRIGDLAAAWTQVLERHEPRPDARAATESPHVASHPDR